MLKSWEAKSSPIFLIRGCRKKSRAGSFDSRFLRELPSRLVVLSGTRVDKMKSQIDAIALT